MHDPAGHQLRTTDGRAAQIWLMLKKAAAHNTRIPTYDTVAVPRVALISHGPCLEFTHPYCFMGGSPPANSVLPPEPGVAKGRPGT